MKQTRSFEDEVRVELAKRHDNLLSWTMLNRKERRAQGVRVRKKELERHLLATGLVISQTDKL